MGYKNGSLEVKIALCGKLRSGKDTVADLLVEDFKFTNFAFSEGIWKVGKLVFPNDFNGTEKPRKLLQEIGQKLRMVDENIWVYYTLNQIEEVSPSRVVISDMRQPNEFNALKEDGFFIIRINASEEVRLERSQRAGDHFTIENLQHETESFIDGFDVDFEIDNNGTVDELKAQTVNAFNEAVYLSKGLQHYEKGANAGG